MKNRACVAILALFAATARADNEPLLGEYLVSTPAPGFVCPGPPGVTTIYNWAPAKTEEIRIKMVYIWWGADKLTDAMDQFAAVEVIVPPAGVTPVPPASEWPLKPLGLVMPQQVDRYGDPVGPPPMPRSFAPDYVSVPPGGGLRITYACTAYGYSVGKHAGVTVAIWYTKAAP